MLNGGLQAVLGLRDAATLTDSARAQRLFRAGDRAARREVAGFDTGAWSLYSERGKESTLNYHELTAGFLGGLCDRVQGDGLLQRRTGASSATSASRRGSASRRCAGPLATARRTVRFTISKVSTREGAACGARAG